MKRKGTVLTAIFLALVIIFVPAAAFAAEEYYMPDTIREIELTPEAREIALEDFDYLVNKILEVSPVQNIVYRRHGVTAEEYFAHMRTVIYENEPLISILSILEPERWALEPVEPLYIAADYLFTLLVIISEELGGLGHMSVQHGQLVEHMIFGAAFTMYMGIEPEPHEIESLLYMGYSLEEIETSIDASLRFSELHNEIFNRPSVVWFYDIDPSLYSFDLDLDEVLGFRNPDNVFTLILDPGHVAYVHIESFTNNVGFDSEILFPFFEEIQDYEHLIIDLRGNGGGWVSYFPLNILTMLIDEQLSFYYYELFIASQLTDGFYVNPTNMAGGVLRGIEPVAEFVESRGMGEFASQDLELLDYAMIWAVEYFPAENNIPFGGEIWILVDEGSASAAELAATISMNTGFATVVGTPTAGVTGVIYTFAALPHTGILFRIDLGYTVDQYGRSIEEFGVIPEVLNAPGLCALDTTIALILGYELPTFDEWLPEMEALVSAIVGNASPQQMVIPPPPMNIPFASILRSTFDGVDFIPLRAVAQAHNCTVAWDRENNNVLIIKPDGSTTAVPVPSDSAFNANGTVFISVERALELFAGLVYVSPIIGTWEWDEYSAFSYVFNADGTGERGFPWESEVFTWFVRGTELAINRTGNISPFEIRNERWTFTVVDNVLTLESLQVNNIVYSYIKVAEVED